MTPTVKRADPDPQHQIDSFVNKRVKATMQFSESASDIQLPTIVDSSIADTSIGDESESTETDLSADTDLPSCWNSESAKHFKQKYPWMIIKEGKLGCNVCAEIKDGKSSHSENWIQCQVRLISLLSKTLNFSIIRWWQMAIPN